MRFLSWISHFFDHIGLQFLYERGGGLLCIKAVIIRRQRSFSGYDL